MSDYYEYYLNNPHERKPKDSDYMPELYQWIENDLEDAIENEDTFVWELLSEEYVNFDLTKTTLRAMFKAYLNRMNATKQDSKDKADQDLLIFTKSLMSAMYEAGYNIINERNV